MASKIEEIIVEPSKIFVGSTFKLKIKVFDELEDKTNLCAENMIQILTEENQEMLTEWT